MLLTLVKYILRDFKSKAQWKDIHQVRFGFEQIGRKNDKPNKQCRYEHIQIERMKAEWIIPKNNPGTDRVLLYLHGGGYAAGSILTHRAHISQLVMLSGVRALMIEYRLAPEHKFPAAVEDAAFAYQWLLDNGYQPEHIAFGGDSAGGGLTVASLLYLRDHQMPLPQCAICLSPWLDLTLTGESQTTKEKIEPMLVKEAMPLWVSNYLGDADPKTPYASPLFDDLHGLPPIYIQVGSDELLLDDSIRFAQKAKEAGVALTMDVYEGYFHVFQAFYRVLRKSREANRKLAEYLKAQLVA